MGEGAHAGSAEPSGLWLFPLLFFSPLNTRKGRYRRWLKPACCHTTTCLRRQLTRVGAMPCRLQPFYGDLDAGGAASTPRSGAMPNNSRGPCAAAAAAAAVAAAASRRGGGTPRRSRAVPSPSDAHTSASCTSAGVDTGRYGRPSGVREVYIHASLGGGRACVAKGEGARGGCKITTSHRGRQDQQKGGVPTERTGMVRSTPA